MKKPSSSDSELFKKAMQDVTPLKNTNRVTYQSRSPKRKIKPLLLKNDVLYPLSDHSNENITAEQFLSFAQQGMQPRYFKNLKAGKLPIEAELDLHGCNIEQARIKLLDFLFSCQKQNLRCLRIIHGKGLRGKEITPQLKTKTYTWLQQIPFILAFCSCQPKDGGTGALYVLLKKQTGAD